VGHTHNHLDQEFSVLSRPIFKAEFIASPDALLKLYSTAHKDVRPLINRQIHAVADYTQYYAPFVHGKLKLVNNIIPLILHIRRHTLWGSTSMGDHQSVGYARFSVRHV